MKKICLLPMLHGMRFDSGKIGVNLSEFFPSTILDAQKPNPNIVVKLTNTNPIEPGEKT